MAVSTTHPQRRRNSIFSSKATATAAFLLVAGCWSSGSAWSAVDPTNAAPTASAASADARRLLIQATFGPTDADLARATALGAAGWVDEQLAMPAREVHLARWNSDDAKIRKANPKDTAGSLSVVSSFYEQALTADDQLRQRVAFALSEIFVVSLESMGGRRSQAIASWLDMLDRNAFGNYRTLLEQVALHPAMGIYLSSVNNRKADPRTGRIPDQNFAREVTQLFSIGLTELNLDGSPRLGPDGKAIDTYNQDDIVGLSRVFTGFGWLPEDPLSKISPIELQSRHQSKPMTAIPEWHATEEKRFLNAVVPAQSVGQPRVSLQTALDTLFKHPNVGPFISRQLIQRLVTSDPSPGYVTRVARVFNDNGSGVRGDLRAVVRAILLDKQARLPSRIALPSYGKLREPVLRLTAWLRAYGVKSDSGLFLIGDTSNPGLSLGQTPLSSPSVFNFYRPGYIPPGGEAAELGLTLPEMQITTETSTAGYVNYMMNAVTVGVGIKGANRMASRPDMQVNTKAELAVASNAAVLTEKVCTRLLGDAASTALKADVKAAIESLVIPAPSRDGGNAEGILRALVNRVRVAQLLVLASPEFIVQK